MRTHVGSRIVAKTQPSKQEEGEIRELDRRLKAVSSEMRRLEREAVRKKPVGEGLRGDQKAILKELEAQNVVWRESNTKMQAAAGTSMERETWRIMFGCFMTVFLRGKLFANLCLCLVFLHFVSVGVVLHVNQCCRSTGGWSLLRIFAFVLAFCLCFFRGKGGGNHCLFWGFSGWGLGQIYACVRFFGGKVGGRIYACV